MSLESAKEATISSPKEKQKEDEFKPFTGEVCPKNEVHSSILKPLGEKDRNASPGTHFSISPSVWRALQEEPEYQKQFKQSVDLAVSDYVKKEFSQIKESSKKEGFNRGQKEGFEAGFKRGFGEGQKLVEQLQERLDEVCRQVLNNQRHVLQSHEKVWASAMAKLLKCFMVPRSEEIIKELSDWLHRSLEEVAPNQKVKIYLPTDEMQRLSHVLTNQGEENWEFRSDDTLKTGELRCESEMGGVIFSPGEQLTKLENWIDEQFPHHETK